MWTIVVDYIICPAAKAKTNFMIVLYRLLQKDIYMPYFF